MKKIMAMIFFVGILILSYGVADVFAIDLGMQASTRTSPVNIEEGLIGLKINLESFAITPKVGFGIFDDPGYEDTIFLLTVGSGFDYYLSDEKLRPYIGGDFFLDFADTDDSDILLTINPHLGAEYWLSDKFSIGGNIGLQFGIGEFLGSEVKFGTTTMIHLTYYF